MQECPQLPGCEHTLVRKIQATSLVPERSHFVNFGEDLFHSGAELENTNSKVLSVRRWFRAFKHLAIPRLAWTRTPPFFSSPWFDTTLMLWNTHSCSTGQDTLFQYEDASLLDSRTPALSEWRSHGA